MPSPRILVPRPRLTRLLAAARVAVVEAGGGFGKTTLARELADELGIAGVVVELTAGDVDGRALLARSREAGSARWDCPRRPRWRRSGRPPDGHRTLGHQDRSRDGVLAPPPGL